MFRHAVAPAAAAALMLSINSAHATVLTFDGSFHVNLADISQNYGDFVTQASVDGGAFLYSLDCGITPEIEVSYPDTSTTETKFRKLGYGDLVNFIHAEHDPGLSQRFLDVTLRWVEPLGYPPEAPKGLVALYSFDVAALIGEDKAINDLQVLDIMNNILFDAPNDYLGSKVFVPGMGHRTFSFDPPIVSPFLRIRLDLSNIGGKSSQVGIDNIKFGQSLIPAPGGMLLLGVAGILTLGRRRRTTI